MSLLLFSFSEHYIALSSTFKQGQYFSNTHLLYKLLNLVDQFAYLFYSLYELTPLSYMNGHPYCFIYCISLKDERYFNMNEISAYMGVQSDSLLIFISCVLD